MSKSLQEQYQSTPLFGSNAAYVEAMYETFLQDPDAVPDGWRRYFEGVAAGRSETPHGPILAAVRARVERQAGAAVGSAPTVARAAAPACRAPCR